MPKKAQDLVWLFKSAMDEDQLLAHIKFLLHGVAPVLLKQMLIYHEDDGSKYPYKSAIRLAVNSQFASITAYLLEQAVRVGLDPAVIINTRDPSNRTLLSIAAEKGQVEIVKLLIDRGANLEGYNTISSPLYLAMSNKHEETIKVLLDAGAYLTDGVIDSWNELLLLVPFMIRNKCKSSFLQTIITEGASINKKDSQGTALQQAKNSPNLKVILEQAGVKGGDPKNIDVAFAKQYILANLYSPSARRYKVKTSLSPILPPSITTTIISYTGSFWEKSSQKEPDELSLFCNKVRELVLKACEGYRKLNQGSSLKKEGLARCDALADNLSKAQSNQRILGLVYNLCFGSNQGSDLKWRITTSLQEFLGATPLKQGLLIMMDIHPTANKDLIDSTVQQKLLDSGTELVEYTSSIPT